MKNLTFARFMNEVEHKIRNLDRKELTDLLLHIAEQQRFSSRNEFLQMLEGAFSEVSQTEEEIEIDELAADEFIQGIKEFQQRIEDGEYFDEDENYEAWEMEERSYYGRDYYDDDARSYDFSDAEYVDEMINFLDTAQQFYRAGDIQTATEGYRLLFGIIENDAYYEDSEIFIYGFSFKEVIDKNELREHKIIHLRCQYLTAATANDFQGFLRFLIKENDINLTEIMEIDVTPLPALDKFMENFIEYLFDKPQYDHHLVDVLFIKGGVEEVKQFAYNHGGFHPPVFLAYYEHAKENNLTDDELIQICLDGIRIIPEKYISRAKLGWDLIHFTENETDKTNQLTGFITAFYSSPSLENLSQFILFLQSGKFENEIVALKSYLEQAEKEIFESQNNFSFYFHYELPDFYSLKTAEIDKSTTFIGLFLLTGIKPLSNYINPKDFLGFQSKLSHVAMISALALKCIAPKPDAVNVSGLVTHYCLSTTTDENIRKLLGKLIIEKAQNITLSEMECKRMLQAIEALAVNRVSHILENKLRGGYDSACLLLVACAEAKQIIAQNGNSLIFEVDSKYKRFTTFRRTLKSLTKQSRLLNSVG